MLRGLGFRGIGIVGARIRERPERVVAPLPLAGDVRHQTDLGKHPRRAREQVAVGARYTTNKMYARDRCLDQI